MFMQKEDTSNSVVEWQIDKSSAKFYWRKKSQIDVSKRLAIALGFFRKKLFVSLKEFLLPFKKKVYAHRTVERGGSDGLRGRRVKDSTHYAHVRTRTHTYASLPQLQSTHNCVGKNNSLGKTTEHFQVR